MLSHQLNYNFNNIENNGINPVPVVVEKSPKEESMETEDEKYLGISTSAIQIHFIFVCRQR